MVEEQKLRLLHKFADEGFHAADAVEEGGFVNVKRVGSGLRVSIA